MVPGCTNGSKKTKGTNISYHRLPKEKKLKKTWLSKISRQNPRSGNSCYVCSAHFTNDCFETSFKYLCGQKIKNALKPGAIPTIFPRIRPKRERQNTIQRRRRQENKEVIVISFYFSIINKT